MSKRFTQRALLRLPELDPKFAARLCRIYCGERGGWYRPESAGYTDDWNQAGTWPLHKAFAMTRSVGPEKRMAFDVAWDYPIIFSAAMVAALLSGSKTMTRRMAWSTHKPCTGTGSIDGQRCLRCRGIGRVATVWQQARAGDTLWVRENWRVSKRHDGTKPRDLKPRTMSVMFEAGGSIANDATGWTSDQRWPVQGETVDWAGKMRGAIHLPFWGSRLTLAVTGARMERLQKIDNADAMSEGITPFGNERDYWDGTDVTTASSRPAGAFHCLWNKLHGEQSWSDNPEVVPISFAVQHGNIHALREAA